MFRHARRAVGTSTRRLPLKRTTTTGSLFDSHHHQQQQKHVHTSSTLRLFQQQQQFSTSRSTNDDHGLDFMTGPSRDDTIYALSSAQGKAGIAVIRVSGPASMDVYQSLCPGKPSPNPRYAAVRTLYHPQHPNDKSHILDSQAMVLYFPAPKTVTGEDLLELHVHGGPATVQAILSALPHCSSSRANNNSSIRYAAPGEFTKRAFFHDRLDLAQVEALSDVLAAETEQQRRAAVRGGAQHRGAAYDAWRDELLLARGEIEALIDFAEDQHFDESPRELLGAVQALVRRVLVGVGRHALAGARSELLRSGIRIALLGPPNVGKSSLLNLVVGREASIVSREAGTTRDVVEVRLDIGGYLCTFADTAGIRRMQEGEAAGGGGGMVIGAVEEEGIRRARLKALSSDVVIVLASVERDEQGTAFLNYDAETLQLAARAEQKLVAVNKCDSVDEHTLHELLQDFKSKVVLPGVEEFAEPLLISCKQAETTSRSQDEKDPGGIHNLTRHLIRSFEKLTSLPEDMQELLGGTERQRQLLAQCQMHLEDFMRIASDGDDEKTEAAAADVGNEPDIVLAAEHLRYAADSLGQITGRGDVGDVEDVLGVIFEKFCVGK